MTLTETVILSTICIWVTYTALAPRFGEKTLSQTLRDGAIRWNWVPMFFGVTIAHWFAPRQSYEQSGFLWVVVALGLVVVWDLVWPRLHGFGDKPLLRYPLLWFLVGLPIGYYFWPQGY